MTFEEIISLDCPYCSKEIRKPLTWFKQSYSTCPHCQGGLAAGQFDAIIRDLEQTLDESIDDFMEKKPSGGCCGGNTSCGCGS